MTQRRAPQQRDVNELLRAVRNGEKQALDDLFSAAYEELRQLARRVRRGENGSLTTTALVHEAYLKLLPLGLPANDAAHVKLLIGRAMRQVLIDAARKRTTRKRGGGEPTVSLGDDVAAAPIGADRLLELDTALEELERIDPRRAAVVECRFFSGLDVSETAAALGLSEPTVKRDWRVARAWLSQAVV